MILWRYLLAKTLKNNLSLITEKSYFVKFYFIIFLKKLANFISNKDVFVRYFVN